MSTKKKITILEDGKGFQVEAPNMSLVEIAGLLKVAITLNEMNIVQFAVAQQKADIDKSKEVTT